MNSNDITECLGRVLETARKTPNRGDLHIFLGDPRSDACDKTTAEPGNSYSPGIWTCGISVWIATDGLVASPETLPAGEISWTLISEPGAAPVAEAGYKVGSLSIRHRLAHLGTAGSEGSDFNVIEITSDGNNAGSRTESGQTHPPPAVAGGPLQGGELLLGSALKKIPSRGGVPPQSRGRGGLSSKGVLNQSSTIHGQCLIVVKDVGPAGAKISGLEWNDQQNTLTINKSLMLVCEGKPDGVLVVQPDTGFDSPGAALGFAFDLKPGESRVISFTTEHGFDERLFAGKVPKRDQDRASCCKDAFGMVADNWKVELPARVFAPDDRVALAWERCAWHVLSAMENGIPRIGVVNYPVFWMRDGVIILRALDLIGRRDLARAGNEYMAPFYFSGGFGAESDAPGEGIWALVSHAKITRDWKWCDEVFPHVVKRIGWIEKMLSAKEPLRMLTENRTPLCQNTPGGNILCLAARDGLIHGRMDFHSPDFYINCWAVAGLRFGARAAGRLGQSRYATKWTDMADELECRIAAVLLPGIKNPRDGIVTPYPTGALAGNRSDLKTVFERLYRAQRLSAAGERIPEKEWTYFEAAQAHNAFLLGMRNEAWISMNGMLEKEGSWDVMAFVEGGQSGAESLPFCNGEGRRGWIDRNRALGGNMPHNWTTSEVVNFIRDAFVVEDGDGLLLGAGVPDSWLVKGSQFGVRNMPTDFGDVSYSVTVGADGACELEYDGPEPYRTIFPVSQQARTKLRHAL